MSLKTKEHLQEKSNAKLAKLLTFHLVLSTNTLISAFLYSYPWCFHIFPSFFPAFHILTVPLFNTAESLWAMKGDPQGPQYTFDYPLQDVAHETCQSPSKCLSSTVPQLERSLQHQSFDILNSNKSSWELLSTAKNNVIPLGATFILSSRPPTLGFDATQGSNANSSDIQTILLESLHTISSNSATLPTPFSYSPGWNSTRASQQ